MKRVFLTGATGFVGKQITEDLIRKGSTVRCLIREGSEAKISSQDEVEISYGDIRDPGSIKGKLAGFDAVINLVGIIREFPRKGITFEKILFEGTKNLVDEARKEKIPKFIQMSALGASIHSTAEYHRTKARAEDYLKLSGLRYTIFRPSIIFGPGDQFVNYFAGMMRRSPFIPVIGDGRYELQPIFVKTISKAFIESLDLPESDYKAFDAGGPEKIEFNVILDTIAEVIGKKARKIHLPPRLMRPFATLMERFPFFPLTSEQIDMLLEGNTCDEKLFFDTFPVIPVSFREGIQSYLKR